MKKNRYSAVMVSASKASCKQAQHFTGRKILTSEFERHILQHCPLADCQCTFKTFFDRRSGKDRRFFGKTNQEITNYERRLSYGRRMTDQHNLARDGQHETSVEILESSTSKNKA